MAEEQTRTYPSVLARIEGDEMYLVALDAHWGRILNRTERRYYQTGLIGTHLVMTGPWEFLAPGEVSQATLAEWIAAAHDMEADMTSEQRELMAQRRAAWDERNRSDRSDQ